MSLAKKLLWILHGKTGANFEQVFDKFELLFPYCFSNPDFKAGNWDEYESWGKEEQLKWWIIEYKQLLFHAFNNFRIVLLTNYNVVILNGAYKTWKNLRKRLKN